MMRNSRDERGIAMMTALMTSSVVMMLGVMAVSIANHNSGASANDRARTQAVHAAEAGVNAAIAQIGRARTEDLPCAAQIVGTAGRAGYRTTVSYYSTHPPVAGTEIPCGSLNSAARPRTARLLSVGMATGLMPITRTMEAEYRMSPIIGGFNSAIFSDSSGASLDFANQLAVTGNSSFDGDIYTNGDWTCSNSSTIEGSVYSQGTATMSSTCLVKGDVWANGAVRLSNSAKIREDAASSTANINVTNSNQYPAIERNASASGSCVDCTHTSGGGGAKKVAGVIAENTPLPAPPVKVFPKVRFNRSAWQADGWEVEEYDDCADARGYIETGFRTAGVKRVVRITEKCGLTFTNNVTVSLPHDLAIVTDGSIAIEQQTTFQSSDSTTKALYFMVPYYYHPDTESEANKQTCTPAPQGNILVGNRTTFTRTNVSMYTPCTADVRNRNVGNGGQIYGGTVIVRNQFDLKYQPMLIPGSGDITGYTLDQAFIREIRG